MTELKPCACGGESLLNSYFNDVFHYVECTKCGITTPRLSSKSEVIRIWNTRQPAINWQPIEELPREPMPILLHGQGRPKYLPAQILEANGEGICLIATEGGVSNFGTIKKIYTHFLELTPPNS
ncbi:Lar family restriction alleviation protein [Entomomonas asaccharolytica]|uniref:Lar family restriction alleviation protein n=1 Tax=Entomomonas asaccharolytica TaxID=2785331 RepID=A0A974RY47_9GAMM|nr:Lar family restriction alleviation protein [Entomomonas asaccharolytica]QQP86900.1 Lar family restriction alleviation protein [Entomomonas asaccharolytica]